jgi:kumamolisin
LKSAIWPRRACVGGVLAAGTAGSVLLLMSAVAPANASPGPQPSMVAVPQGVDAAALKGASVFPVKGKTKETVSFVLKARDLSGLEARVEGGMKGGYLSVGSFTDRYGQTAGRVAALRNYLSRFGLKTHVYADQLDVTATGTAADFNKALSVKQSEFTTKAVPARGDQAAIPAFTFHGTTDKPLLPRSIASYVDAILGLTDYPVASSDAVRSPLQTVRSDVHGEQLGNRTPAEFAKQYGLTPLYRKGAKGQGETVGIITFASVRPSDAEHFWSSVLKIKTKADRIRLDNIDGGSGKVSAAKGSGETTLDLEQSGAVAPDANVIVYQAPNTDFGAADAWFAAASQNRATSVSTSWGESEIFNEGIADNGTEAATFNSIFNEPLLEMAAQGQTAFDAAGDSGAYDDAHDVNAKGNSTPYTELAVDNPADSPWITTGGGTTEAGTIPLISNVAVTIASQRAWGWDYLYPYYALAGAVTEAAFVENPAYAAGTGGGYSTVFSRPGYQRAIPNIGNYTAVPYATPTDCMSASQTGCADFPGSQLLLPTAWTAWPGADTNTVESPTPPSLITGSASGRGVPDLSTDADPDTGYLRYFTGQSPALQAGWGGTSFVGPQLNGSAAVIDSYLGHRTGFWNPAIYKFAAGRNSPFTPLSSASANNDNLYYTGTAGSLWNPGTGLGVPNLAKLAADFRAER